MGFGDRLEALRLERGISVRELAKRLGDVSANTVGAWIEGGDPRLSQVLRVAEFFAVTPAELLDMPAAGRPAAGLPDDEKEVLVVYRAHRDVLGADAAARAIARAAVAAGAPRGATMPPEKMAEIRSTLNEYRSNEPPLPGARPGSKRRRG